MQSHIAPVVVTALLLGIVAVIASKVAAKPRYRAVPLLTGNEKEFFERLRRALPEALVFPPVAMSAIIQPLFNGKQRTIDFRRISQKRVDYAVYDRQLALVAVAELDDRTHDAARDAVRDGYLASAGVRTVRFQSKAKPDEKGIRAALYPPETRVQATERSSFFSQV
ncbi:DUF2726 domain-containing protein [Caballeronia grimmiae]|uniref:DUF2726 domain-containing protein n=1 Tax=Caballeronia grimmiae TaxID=1071679 RepID=A0A069N9Y4_9BURK|nr:DUF2726 domain-containing protein [Caballeronia grimmiae]KDR25193.1 hypothetical protein BG57_31785 [Caballeronia grimmiae]GGD98318.1 hypothetical protein GCM10010985_61350 [Caballeronia grimmiae]